MIALPMARVSTLVVLGAVVGTTVGTAGIAPAGAGMVAGTVGTIHGAPLVGVAAGTAGIALVGAVVGTTVGTVGTPRGAMVGTPAGVAVVAGTAPSTTTLWPRPMQAIM